MPWMGFWLYSPWDEQQEQSQALNERGERLRFAYVKAYQWCKKFDSAKEDGSSARSPESYSPPKPLIRPRSPRPGHLILKWVSGPSDVCSVRHALSDLHVSKFSLEIPVAFVRWPGKSDMRCYINSRNGTGNQNARYTLSGGRKGWVIPFKIIPPSPQSLFPPRNFWKFS